MCLLPLVGSQRLHRETEVQVLVAELPHRRQAPLAHGAELHGNLVLCTVAPERQIDDGTRFQAGNAHRWVKRPWLGATLPRVCLHHAFPLVNEEIAAAS
jgi:hypothetical protein